MTKPDGNWKVVPGWNGIWASEDGRIWQDPAPRVRRPGLRRQSQDPVGYLRVCAVGPHGPGAIGVHVLVASAFHGPRPSGSHVPDHIDHDPTNNHAANLEWVTVSENLRRAWAAGRFSGRQSHS